MVTSRFGRRIHPITYKSCFHDGVDFNAEQNDAVLSVFDGVVTCAGKRGGYGIAVEVLHPGQNLKSIVGHLTSIAVKPGQSVKQGQALGFAGSTGLSSGTHVHLSVRNSLTDKLLNPLCFMDSMPEVTHRRARTYLASAKAKSSRMASARKRTGNRTLVANHPNYLNLHATKRKRANHRLAAHFRPGGRSRLANAT
jgi:hypothetical protein